MLGRTIASVILSLSVAACGAVPSGSSGASRSAGSSPVTSVPPVAVTADARICLAELASTGSSFSALPDRYDAPGCAMTGAVQMSAVRGDAGDLGLGSIGPVQCETARVFIGWARYGVDRAARQILGSPIDRIETMGSYSCRNVAGTSRRSAHVTAEAIDIGAFVLEDGRRISVESDWANGTREEREFLRVVHNSACRRFGTVLGPDYNAAHRDHLHVEIGGGGFCR